MFIPTHEIKNDVYSFSFSEQDKKVHKALSDILGDNTITITGNIYPIKGGYDINGEIHAQVPTQCSFCAKDMTIPVNEKFHQVMLISSKNARNPAANDFELSYISGTEIDLSEVVREILNVSVPIQPQCSEERGSEGRPVCIPESDYKKYFVNNSSKEDANPFSILKNLRKN